MWHSRQWRRLLNFIDHLPRNSHYTQAVVNDEEHARMLVEAMDGQPKEDPAPPMSTWSPEVEQLVTLTDAVRALNLTVQGLAGAKPPKFVPSPRPRTMMEKARRDQRKRKHEELVALVLPPEERIGG